MGEGVYYKNARNSGKTNTDILTTSLYDTHRDPSNNIFSVSYPPSLSLKGPDIGIGDRTGTSSF